MFNKSKQGLNSAAWLDMVKKSSYTEKVLYPNPVLLRGKGFLSREKHVRPKRNLNPGTSQLSL